MFRTSLPSSKQWVVNHSDELQSSPTLLTFAHDQGFPIDLIRFSIQAEKRKSKKYHTPQASYSLLYAAPLISINHRDVHVLDELFLRDDMVEIEREIEGVLEKFMPEPCWDEDLFEGLSGLI
jgi:hypothetical protein